MWTTFLRTHEQAINVNISQTPWWFRASRQWKGRGRAPGLLLSLSIHQPINNPTVSRWHEGRCSLRWRADGERGRGDELRERAREQRDERKKTGVGRDINRLAGSSSGLNSVSRLKTIGRTCTTDQGAMRNAFFYLWKYGDFYSTVFESLATLNIKSCARKTCKELMRKINQ